MNRQKLPAVIDGNDLLRTAVINETSKLKEDHPVKSYSTALIKNRWNSDTSYDSTFLSSEPSPLELDRPIGALKYPLGKSYTPEYYETKQSTKNLFGIGERLFTSRQLANVGPVLMARASGEVFFSNENFNPQNLGVQIAAATIPSPVQLGVSKVEEVKLRALDVLRNLQLDADGIGDSSLSSVAPGNAFSSLTILNSWGVLNNQFDKFSAGNLGMQILAIALILAVTFIPALLLENAVFGGDDSGAGGQSQYTKDRDAIGRYQIGSYRGGFNLGGSFNIASLLAGQTSWKNALGFPKTQYPLDRCMAIGTLVFFNITVNDQGLQPGFYGGGFGLGKAIAEAVSQQNPEAYVIFARAISRSFLQLANKILELVASIVTPVAFAAQLLNFINFFRSSQIIQTLNMFAQLGDKILTIPVGIEDPAAVGVGKKMSEIDMSTIDQEASVKKSRLISGAMRAGDASLRLAWSSFRASDLLAYPKYLDVVPSELTHKEIGKPRMFPLVEPNHQKGISPKYDGLTGGIYHNLEQSEDRIPTNVRETFERVLGGEYMPFYFHDVRTNEIISFHAFLLSLGDSYSASYDSIDAMGRVEAVKTYKSTSRKIDLSFQVAALSHEDFDYMWLKLNKLATLVYPQFSPGRFAEDDNFKITIPFSQQIAAAPMVRLRIGDLIHSNYSRFNLARLFGYGYDDHVVSAESGTGKSELQSDADVDAKQASFNEAIEALNEAQKDRQAAFNKQVELLSANEAAEEVLGGTNVETYPKSTPPPPAAAPGKVAPKKPPPPPQPKKKNVPTLGAAVYTVDPSDLLILHDPPAALVAKKAPKNRSIQSRLHPDLALVPLEAPYANTVSRQFTIRCLVVPNYEKLGLAYDLSDNDLKPAKGGKPAKAQQAVEKARLQKLINDFTPVPGGLTSDAGQVNAAEKASAGGGTVPNELKILGLEVEVENAASLTPTPKTKAMIVARAEQLALATEDVRDADEEVSDAKKEVEEAKKQLAKYTAANKNFMDPEKNVIVKSFESSGGRGLPGFIESLSFDWYTSTTWEIDAGRGKAPKMCKVTISFSPFHDITPGLDHKGANRAPLYNVGPTRKYYNR